MSARLHYLDNLRTFAVMLVILHHTAITYGAVGGWYYREVNDFTLTSVILTLFCAVNQSFFMGLLFFISGYFTPLSCDRKGPARFLTDKLIRLGVPLLAYIFIIGPLLIYFLFVRGQASLAQYYTERILTFRDVNVGPLWFVQALLIFNFAYAAMALRRNRTEAVPHAFPSRRALLAAAMLTGASAFAIRLAVPTGKSVFGLQIGFFASYVLLFAAGVMAYRSGWLGNIPLRTRAAWIKTSGVAVVFLPAALAFGMRFGGLEDFAGGLNPLAAFYALWEPFVAFGIILGLLALFRRYCNCGNAFLRAVSGSSYTAYIIHAPVLVGISMLVRSLAAPPAIKFLAVGAVGTAACFALAFLIVRVPGVSRVL